MAEITTTKSVELSAERDNLRSDSGSDSASASLPESNKILLGQFLVQSGTVTVEEVEEALEIQQKVGGRIGALLLRIGAISEDALLDALSEQLAIEIIGDDTELPTIEQLSNCFHSSAINSQWLLKQQVLIWNINESTIAYAGKDILNSEVLTTLEYFYPAHQFHPYLMSNQDLDNCIQSIHQMTQSNPNQGDDISILRELAEEAPVVELVNSLMSQAMEQNASDIHIEPEEKQFVVRFRIDGVLVTRLRVGIEKFNAVASRVKLISNIDIAERRLPQDGRFTTRASGVTIDVRVSSLPGIHGESIVMRLLPKEFNKLKLSKLGLLEDHLQLMKKLMAIPHGIFLVTGPTGSGKSTTLYTALDETNDGVKKIITVEDPVELHLNGITQIQAHSDIGFTFAKALRSILRQDPDVVMIGEIRDLETAEIAVQASLTGHLVLSTLHTNDAISAFTRLIDMGVEPFLVAEPVVATQAQRLVRKLCTHCSKPQSLLGNELELIAPFIKQLFSDKKSDWRQAVGCKKCQNTGYSGRLGIYEIIEMTPEMQKLIVARADVSQMHELARSQGYRTLAEDGLIKAFLGITSIEEVFRVTSFVDNKKSNE